jgi:hypothetical protein
LEFEEATAVEDTMIVDPQELDFHSIFDEIDVEDVSDVTSAIALGEESGAAAAFQEDESTGDYPPDFLEEPPEPPKKPLPKASFRRGAWIAGAALVVLILLGALYRFGVSDSPAQLAVTFIPPDARFELDGREIPGSSPVQVPGLPPRRTYRVGLFRDGYEPLQTELYVWPGLTKRVSLKMEKMRSGTIRITSDPSGAAIYVDGQPTGKVTPDVLMTNSLKFPLVIGLSKGGAPIWQQRLERPPGSSQALHGNLNVEYGQLDVESSPSGAQVILEGKTIGKTPLRAFSLPALQELELEIALKGFETYRTTLKVHPSEKEKIYHALRKEPSR